MAHDTTRSESQAFVQPDAYGIRCIDAADEHVVILRLRRGDDRGEQRAPGPLAAEASIDIERMLDGVLVRGPRAERTVAAETHELARIVLEADDGISAAGLGLEPRGHRFRRARLVVVQRRRIGDGLVEDREDGRGVEMRLAVDEFHFFRMAQLSRYFAKSPLLIVRCR